MAIYRHAYQGTARPHHVILISLMAFISATLTMIGCATAATPVPTAAHPSRDQRARILRGQGSSPCLRTNSASAS